MLIFPEHEFILSFVGYSFIFYLPYSSTLQLFYCYDRRMFGPNFGDVGCMCIISPQTTAICKKQNIVSIQTKRSCVKSVWRCYLTKMFYITATSSTAQVYRPNVFVTLVTWRSGRVHDAEAAFYWLISDAGRGRSPRRQLLKNQPGALRKRQKDLRLHINPPLKVGNIKAGVSGRLCKHFLLMWVFSRFISSKFVRVAL